MMGLMALGFGGALGLVEPPRALSVAAARERDAERDRNAEREKPAAPAAVAPPAMPAEPGAAPAPSPNPSVRPPGVPEVVEVRQILVQHAKSWKRAEQVTRTKEEAKKRCGEALAKLEKGVPWDKVMDEYSDSPSTKKNGGSIGPVTWEQANWLVKEPIFKLKLDERSPVTESPFGFHVYQRIK
jgi:hypothetical protein